MNPATQSVNPLHRLARFADLPQDLRHTLENIKPRMPPGEMEALVWRLCDWQPLSTEQLSTLLDRNRNYVTNRLLTPMLKAGRLEMTLPDQPNHPQQQYRAGVPPQGGAS